MWDDFNAAVQAIDVAALDRAGLGDLAGEIGRTRAVLDGLEARMTVGLRRLGASEASAAETLRRRTGCSTREAKHRARRAEALRRMPNVADALSSGRLTGEHASALARAAAETSPEAVDRDAGLLVEASSMPADAASSKARDWVRHRQTNDDLERLHQWQRRNRSLLFTAGEGGMIAGIAKFDRVSGAQFQNLVEALADRLYRADGGRDNPHSRTRAQCRHDALLTLVGLEPATHPPLAASASTPSSNSDDTTTSSAPSSAGSAPSPAGSAPSPAGSTPSPAGSAPSSAGSAPSSHSDDSTASSAPSSASSGSSAPSSNSEDSTARSAPSSDSDDSTASSGPGGHRPVLEVAGHNKASPSPRLFTPRPEFLPDLGSCSLPGTGPDADHGTIHGPSPGPGVGGGKIHGPGSGLSPSSSLGCACGRGFGPKAQLCVVMDVPYLATNVERGRCEIPGVGAIARSELERLGCDAELYGLLFDQQGLPLYHGRKTRSVSPQQWRVLVARDKGCVICGAHTNWCQAHHVKYWRLGGPTDIDNLVLLCHAHHRWVHDNEIILRQGPNGWHAPTGLPPPSDVTGRSARSLTSTR